ncbi:MAG TPA: hypothetical protein VGK67_15845 [Myxococcales bacterium]|jgi:hypothetical protein
MLEIHLGEMSEEALRAVLREQVAQRRAFVPGLRGVQPQTACELVVALPSGALRLPGEVVFACQEGAGCGVGLQLEPLRAAALAALDAFLRAEKKPEPPAPAPATPAPAPEVAEAELEDEPANPSAEYKAMHLKMRSLTGTEQRKVAQTGNLSERVLVERLYGPNVWEALLSSGRLSLPEVATIARKGTVPKPLLDLIGANTGWLASEQVQRALLGNPRTSHPLVKKILRLLPKHELARVPNQTAYPMSVRQAAVVLLKPERR